MNKHFLLVALMSSVSFTMWGAEDREHGFGRQGDSRTRRITPAATSRAAASQIAAPEMPAATPYVPLEEQTREILRTGSLSEVETHLRKVIGKLTEGHGFKRRTDSAPLISQRKALENRIAELERNSNR